MAEIPFIVFYLFVLVFSAIVHEVAHGYVAELLGDPTARLAGRLTLNPIAHISFFGMVILPILTYWAWGIPIGGAKPVPYNPRYLRNPVRGGAFIAVAGPLSNLFIAVIFGVFIRVFPVGPATLPFAQIVRINVLLAIFNLVPIPPLDGSKVVTLLLPTRILFRIREFLDPMVSIARANRFLFLILLFIFFPYILRGVFSIVDPVINFIYVIIAGQSFGI